MDNKPAGTDRRRNPRTRMNRPGRIRVDGSAQSYTQVVDISSQGAALYCASAIAPGTLVEVQLPPLKMNPETVHLTMLGRVDRSYARGDSHLVRVRFVEPTVHAVKAIAQFVQYRVDKA